MKRTLESIARMNISDDISREIIIVDNNSSDRTKDIVEKFSIDHQINVKYQFEKKQGKSFALNRGISVAQGEILVFTDDDVIVHKNWLVNIIKLFRETNVACAGGKVLLDWEAPRPDWLGNLLVDQLGYLDLGEEIIRLSIPKIYGANLAVRSRVIEKYGGFDTQIGPIAGKMYSGEDTYFIEKLLMGQEAVLYSPDIVVYHRVPKNHTSKKYFLKRMFDQGESIGIQMGNYDKRKFMEIPYYMYNEFFVKIYNVIIHFSSGPDKTFVKKIDLARTIGMMYGRLKIFLSEKTLSSSKLNTI